MGVFFVHSRLDVFLQNECLDQTSAIEIHNEKVEEDISQKLGGNKFFHSSLYKKVFIKLN